VISTPRVALITGGSSGFGRLTALALARDGYQVVAAFRGSRGGFERQAAELQVASAGGTAVQSVQLDVTDDTSVARAVADVVDRLGHIDVLVNAAGYGLLGPMECTSIAQAQELFDTNVFGTMRMCKAVVPIMREQGSGYVLNFGSDVGLRPNFFQSGYASSKFAVDGDSQVLRLELRRFGIGVALVSPGWYSTEFGESAVTTFGTGDAAAVYADLVQEWNDGVARVEGPNDQPAEVAELVRRMLSQPDTPYRNPVGWNPERMAGVQHDEIDRYQKHLLDYYQLHQHPHAAPADGSLL